MASRLGLIGDFSAPESITPALNRDNWKRADAGRVPCIVPAPLPRSVSGMVPTPDHGNERDIDAQ
jgi:hypothetical protein